MLPHANDQHLLVAGAVPSVGLTEFLCVPSDALRCLCLKLCLEGAIVVSAPGAATHDVPCRTVKLLGSGLVNQRTQDVCARHCCLYLTLSRRTGPLPPPSSSTRWRRGSSTLRAHCTRSPAWTPPRESHRLCTCDAAMCCGHAGPGPGLIACWARGWCSLPATARVAELAQSPPR